jgi:FlaA1/EpsC-like NDP-sugar epimerase
VFDSITKRKIPFLVADIILIALAVYFSFFLRFEGQIPPTHMVNMQGAVVLTWLFCLPVFYFFRLYSFSWKYVSTEELVLLAKAQILGFLFLSATIFVLRDWAVFSGFPRSALFISFVLIFGFCGFLRFAKRIGLQIVRESRHQEKERTLIVGAGDAGEHILRNILNSSDNLYRIVGFIDDNTSKQGLIIHGLKVFGKINDIPEIVKEQKIEGLIVALPSAGSEAIRRAVESGRQAGLKKIKIVPPLDELINGQITLGDLKDLEMEDLLGRDPVFLDEKLISDFIKNKRVLVTGAAGSIGSELCRQIVKFKPQHLFLLDQDETGIFDIQNELKNKYQNIVSFIADIKDEKKIEWVFKYAHPEIVFHAAAYKHVPLMEANPDEAIENNIFGTEIIALTSVKNNVEKFVFISTDKAVSPVSIMGAAKRVGEMICQAINDDKGFNLNGTKFVSVRFGNVLGSRGSIVPIFQEKIKKRQPLEITHPDMKRYFMTIPEACLLVLEAGAQGEGGEVLVLDMGDPIKIFDLAKNLIKLSGLEPDKDIPIIFTQPRPGEKFFENILTAEEGTIASQSKNIYRAKLSKVSFSDLKSKLLEIKKILPERNKEKIKEELKKIVPSFKPNN